jgi:(p)ppGpp synthase/HD superfamily hydrolase
MLGARSADAFLYAAEAHHGQNRKGTTIPYIAHPLAVCALVLEYGGDEDEVGAAFLHDVAEDAENGADRLREIGELFGSRVQRIVTLCSDTIVKPKPEWAVRKTAYIERVRKHATAPDADVGYLRVSASDKLHNSLSILADLGRTGNEVFDRFSADKKSTIGYYRDLADAFSRYRGDPGMERLAVDLIVAVSELIAVADA